MRGVSPQLAALTGKYLIVDSRPSQSAYALSDHLLHSDPVVQRFEAWARARLPEGFSLDEAARAVGASKRTLARRMEMLAGQIEKLSCNAPLWEPDEGRASESLGDLTRDGIEFVTQFRRHEVALQTWLVESFNRDLGTAD